MNMKKFLLTFILSLLAAVASFGQGNYGKDVYKASDGTSVPYRFLAPKEMKQGKKYPLVLFLHGAGERGSDNEKQLIHGGQMFLNPVNREEHPAFVLFPQCPEDGYWAYSSRPDFEHENMPANPSETPLMKAVMELVQKYIDSGKVDAKRIYVMGLSMGGMATYDLIARYPDFFAAAIPICGAVNVERFTVKPSFRIRIYHGDADPVVPVNCSRMAYLKLKSLGAKVEYKEYIACGHNSWTPAFSEPDFMDWLFKQHR
jgi:predicted peptidase